MYQAREIKHRFTDPRASRAIFPGEISAEKVKADPEGHAQVVANTKPAEGGIKTTEVL